MVQRLGRDRSEEETRTACSAIQGERGVDSLKNVAQEVESRRGTLSHMLNVFEF
jgi:hypothetical protein